MNWSSTQIAIFLISYYSVLEGHTVDVHFPSAGEWQMEDRIRRDKENEEAEDTLNNPGASNEDREKAAEKLQNNGIMA